MIVVVHGGALLLDIFGAAPLLLFRQGWPGEDRQNTIPCPLKEAVVRAAGRFEAQATIEWKMGPGDSRFNG
ncbi:MAG: hypothetical protein SWE60_19010 [Thermodesulfobacteriota bacterium]|nr:hypothetical protein [Thermodesulfobacteriota bacterium]